MDPIELARPKEILLIEDSPTDIKMVLRAFSLNARQKNITSSTDGEQAMAHLKNPAKDRNPDLILLDLNLPKMDGWQVLALCKSDAALKRIPIVVFTTSSLGSDIKRCYELGANSFVSKPFELEAFQQSIEMIEDYWLGLSTNAA